MCNRIRKPGTLEFSQIRLRFGARERPGGAGRGADRQSHWQPGDTIAAIYLDAGIRVAEELRWGLIPAWEQSEVLPYHTHNARAERITEAASYRGAWRKGQRCLLPMEAFYERGRPFCLASGEIMMAAGIWDDWRNPIGGTIRSCSMITTRPNELVAPVHDRMPVIIAPQDWAAWLGEMPATEVQLQALMRPFPAELMTMGAPPAARRSAPSSAIVAPAQGSLF